MCQKGNIDQFAFQQKEGGTKKKGDEKQCGFNPIVIEFQDDLQKV